ncbi:transmembrane protein 120B isoform X1 [Scleropages formosus]|uniref:transmembrane protein 120B isoform X1 n=1 Tax=Scleropages formosus TaxID=113540 RepID=UPI000878E7B5|nr:transmembrane protein 120B isoform X1 [Scleropages formosus]
MSLQRCQAEWEEIEQEYQQLQSTSLAHDSSIIWEKSASNPGKGIYYLEQLVSVANETHKVYRHKLDELTNLQTICSNSISKLRKRLRELEENLYLCTKPSNQNEAEDIKSIWKKIKDKQHIFFDMEAYLPKKNGLYLNLVLGNVNVTLLSNQAKFAYKDEYEKFKLCVTVILLLGAITCKFLLNYRVIDEIFNFLLVWYYCTLTIRESILVTNGSRIKGWWVSHHYVSTFLSGVMLTWLCTVPAVLLPKWLSLQVTSLRGEESVGSDCGGFSILDVEGAHFPPALPLLWSFLAALQCRDSVSAGWS